MNRGIRAKRLYPVLERQGPPAAEDPLRGNALGRVVEAHPALSDLMDFCLIDPVQVAIEVGMVSSLEEDALEDLREINLGDPDWYESSVGLSAVREALAAIRQAPQSVCAAIYDPELSPEEVITDLEAFEQTLLAAQQHETRFHFKMEETAVT